MTAGVRKESFTAMDPELSRDCAVPSSFRGVFPFFF